MSSPYMKGYNTISSTNKNIFREIIFSSENDIVKRRTKGGERKRMDQKRYEKCVILKEDNIPVIIQGNILHILLVLTQKMPN